jgi:hypothetical protein
MKPPEGSNCLGSCFGGLYSETKKLNKNQNIRIFQWNCDSCFMSFENISSLLKQLLTLLAWNYFANK